jgi:glycogen phosphorylase
MAPTEPQRTLAYFSMEIALDPSVPTYSGGLGVLAGDTLRSAADMELPMVAVSLLYRRGYFQQGISAEGWQQETPVVWPVEQHLQALTPRVTVMIEGRTVHLRAWQFQMRGTSGAMVPVYLLDADVPDNTEADRTLTHTLYGGDPRYRLCQEVLLGIGGIRMLRALGHHAIVRFHMNEGHASLLTLELLEEELHRAGRQQHTPEDLDAVRQRCVFTTHTPVAAGHDQFPLELVERVLGRCDMLADPHVFCCDGMLNMTYLALNLSRYVNGVAKKHGEVSRLMFAGYQIDAITNGVHAGTWVAPPLQQLFDDHIPGWHADNFSLRYALSIPRSDIWDAHIEAKQALFARIQRAQDIVLDVDVFTLGFARRATAYKRSDLLLHDLDRLRRMTAAGRPLQLIFAGKAHPADQWGKEIIQRLVRAARASASPLRIVYVEAYDMAWGQLITSGVDLWLNTPQPPLEASGTSGMKAALNGVPSLSILDGWWIEGCLEGITGWAIGTLDGETGHAHDAERATRDAKALYEKLDHVILPLFYDYKRQYIDVMRHAIALNGSFFNTQRMLQQYIAKAYF